MTGTLQNASKNGYFSEVFAEIDSKLNIQVVTSSDPMFLRPAISN